MQYKNTIEAIYISLDEIQKLVSGLGAEEQISAIDIDLATDKLRHVYDLFLSLKSELVPDKLIEKTPDNIINATTEESTEQDNIIEFDLDSVSDESYKEPDVESKETPVNQREIEQSEENLIKTKAELHSRAKPKIPDSKKSLGDTLKKDAYSINDELSQKRTSSKVTDQVSQKPISSITSAIGINEKFEIISNLFDGDKDRYESTMHVLNGASNFNEAYEYISNTLKWNMDTVYTQRILELIRRKLIVKKNE